MDVYTATYLIVSKCMAYADKRYIQYLCFYMCACQYLHKSITLCVFVYVCVCVIKPVLCTQISVYVNTLRYKNEKNEYVKESMRHFIYIVFFIILILFFVR